MLRTEGVRSAIRKAVAKCVYGRVIVLGLDLVGWDLSTTVSVDVRELDASGVPAYLLARPDLTAADVHRRLGTGDRCFVTWADDRISSAVWFGTKTMVITETRSRIDLDPDQVYAYDSWTDPDLRGRNIATARGITTCATLRDAGFRQMVAYVLAGNRAGMRPPAKLGFRRVATVGSVRLGAVRLDFASRDGARTQWRLNESRHRWSELTGAR